MTSLDRLPLKVNRRLLLGSSAGAAVAWQFGWYGDIGAQSGSSYTFLVLGLDTREENADQRSDIIMVARVNAGEGSVRALSIPRDLFLEIPGYGNAKINAAYQYGLAGSDLDWRAAAGLTRDTITHNFGVEIDGIALTDMNRFPAIIDAVGGVDVVNPYDLGEPDAATNLLFPEGPLHLDGEDALLYCRLRHQDGDGGRVMRQHLVLEALLEKVQSPAMLPGLPNLIASVNQAVRTDVPAGTQAELMSILPSLSEASLAFTNIDSQLSPGYTDGGAWIYEADWTTLPDYVQGWLDGSIEEG